MGIFINVLIPGCITDHYPVFSAFSATIGIGILITRPSERAVDGSYVYAGFFCRDNIIKPF